MNTVSPFPANRKRTALRVSSAVLTLMLGAGFVPTQSPRAAFAAADKFYLLYRAQAGQVKKTKEDATIKFEAAGQSFTMDFKGTSKVTFSKVSPNGEVTIEDKTESEEYMINGVKRPQEAVNEDTSAVTFKPNGEIVGFKEEKKDKDEEDEDHLGIRLAAATTPIFPQNTVGAGDKWSHDYKANSELGTRDAHADFELVGFEKIGAINTAKIKLTYAESGSDALTTKGIVYVDVATGDPIRDEFEATGIPFSPDGTKATGTFHDERTDGGPYAANQIPKPLTEAPKMVASATAMAAKPDDKKPGAAAKPGDTKPIEAAKPPEAKKEKNIDETVKEGFTKIPGLVTLYRKKEAGKDTIYAELPEDQLGKMMMLQTTAATGTAEQIVAGDPISDIVFKLEKIDDRIFFTIPNFYYRAANPEIAKSVRRSFADGYLQVYKIEAKQAERKSLLIDVSDLFQGDMAQISAAFSGGGGLFGPPGGGGFGMDRSKTFVKEIKNFPENLVVSTQYHFQRGGRGFSAALADPRSAPITVIYNLSVLPDTKDYTPRLADDRVGYFETGFQSFDDDSKRDQLTRYIQRWDLKKKDPAAALSEPVKPIVFWLDNAIPKEYRPAFEKGLLIWNAAFEKAGFKNAIVVKQMPDTPDPKDTNTPTDTADMRFNCIRYVHSPENAYAVALFRTNPMTGQILNASITVDAGILRFTKVEHQKQIDPAQAFAYGAGIPQEEERMRQKLAGAAAGASLSTFGATGNRHGGADPRSCSLAHEAKTQAHFGYHALSAQSSTGTLSPTDMKAYLDQFIIEVVGHEFGHIIGLRHNFIASKEYTLAQLGDKTITDKGGIGASLMDYNAFNIAALNKKGAAYYSTAVGTYDRWAVEYGYVAVPAAKTPDDEKFALAQIAKQSGMPGHAYLSDEVADSFDPDVARFDMGKDNLEYQKQAMALSRKLLATLDKRVPKNGESYWEFTQDFNTLLGLYSRSAGYATRFIGGQNISHSHRGDMNEKPALSTVSADTQRQALGMLITYVFAPDAMPVPKRYYAKLASDPTGFGADEAPMLDRLSSIQRSALSRLFSSTMLSRIANNEYKATAKEKPITLPYLYQTVGSNVWAEIPAKTSVNPLRRNLQRAYVDRMIDVALKGGVNADAQMLAWNELRGMRSKLATAKAIPTLDTYTRAHYADSFDKISRALDARITLGQASSGPSMGDLLSLLMGKTAQNDTAPAEGIAPTQP